MPGENVLVSPFLRCRGDNGSISRRHRSPSWPRGPPGARSSPACGAAAEPSPLRSVSAIPVPSAPGTDDTLYFPDVPDSHASINASTSSSGRTTLHRTERTVACRSQRSSNRMIIVRAPSPSFSLHGRWISADPLSRPSHASRTTRRFRSRYLGSGPTCQEFSKSTGLFASRRLRHKAASGAIPSAGCPPCDTPLCPSENYRNGKSSRFVNPTLTLTIVPQATPSVNKKDEKCECLLASGSAEKSLVGCCVASSAEFRMKDGRVRSRSGPNSPGGGRGSMRLSTCVFVVIATSGAGLGGLAGAAGAGGERFHAPKPPQMPSQPVFHMPSHPRPNARSPRAARAPPIRITTSTPTRSTPRRRTNGPPPAGRRDQRTTSWSRRWSPFT